MSVSSATLNPAPLMSVAQAIELATSNGFEPSFVTMKGVVAGINPRPGEPVTLARFKTFGRGLADRNDITLLNRNPRSVSFVDDPSRAVKILGEEPALSQGGGDIQAFAGVLSLNPSTLMVELDAGPQPV
jgi:hypothetical protein